MEGKHTGIVQMDLEGGAIFVDAEINVLRVRNSQTDRTVFFSHINKYCRKRSDQAVH